MPIVEKAEAIKSLKGLMDRVDNLKTILKGSEPSINLWNHYALNEKDYVRDFVHVDPDDLKLAIIDLEGTLKELKKSKAYKAAKRHSSV